MTHYDFSLLFQGLGKTGVRNSYFKLYKAEGSHDAQVKGCPKLWTFL